MSSSNKVSPAAAATSHKKIFTLTNLGGEVIEVEVEVFREQQKAPTEGINDNNNEDNNNNDVSSSTRHITNNKTGQTYRTNKIL